MAACVNDCMVEWVIVDCKLMIDYWTAGKYRKHKNSCLLHNLRLSIWKGSTCWFCSISPFTFSILLPVICSHWKFFVIRDCFANWWIIANPAVAGAGCRLLTERLKHIVSVRVAINFVTNRNPFIREVVYIIIIVDCLSAAGGMIVDWSVLTPWSGSAGINCMILWSFFTSTCQMYFLIFGFSNLANCQNARYAVSGRLGFSYSSIR